jgi:hypothetical protein
VLAAAGVDDTGVVEAPAGLAHALDAPIKRVVVGSRHDLEAELHEILCHRGVADDRVVGIPGVWIALEAIHVDQ